jgi:hypothetical protein
VIHHDKNEAKFVFGKYSLGFRTATKSLLMDDRALTISP